MSTANLEPIFSTLAADPDLGPIVDLFVEEMPRRILDLLERLQASDGAGLRNVAHQIKGSAGSYGFPRISPAAALLESALQAPRSPGEIHALVHDLVDLCRSVRRGTRND